MFSRSVAGINAKQKDQQLYFNNLHIPRDYNLITKSLALHFSISSTAGKQLSLLILSRLLIQPHLLVIVINVRDRVMTVGIVMTVGYYRLPNWA